MIYMVYTKNKYIYPIALSKKVKVSYKKSPAHINKLKYAVDFIVEEGTKIKAALNGIVVDIKQNSNKLERLKIMINLVII